MTGDPGFKVWAKYAVGAAVVLLLQAGAIWFWYGPLDKACGNDVFARLPGPGRFDVAYVFQRDCGIFSGYSANVAVRRGYGGGALKDEDNGNVLVASGPSLDPQDVLSSVRARWEGEALVVSYDDRLRVKRRDGAAGGGMIRFEPFKGE